MFSETTVSTDVRLMVSSRNSELQQRVADYRQDLLAEVWGLVADALAEALAEIDRALEQCLAVPALRAVLPPAAPALVADAVKESLLQQVADAWEQDRRVAQVRAERARHKMPSTETPLVKPIVAPAWSGVDTLLTAKRG